MATETHLQDITHTIQLAVAPVFLLTALGTTLSVLTTRLGRVVDRARWVEDKLRDRLQAPSGESTDLSRAARASLLEELRLLAYRARLIHWAISAGTTSAILVCLLIAGAFIGYLFDAHVGAHVAVLFILAISAYVVALLFFLREIFLAIATLRFGMPAGAAAEGRSGGGGG
jgi:hypothetical protein